MTNGSEFDSTWVQRWRSTLGTMVALATLLGGSEVLAAEVTLDRPLTFHPGTPKARTMLLKAPDLQDLAAEDFGVAAADLNDDGRAELIVQSYSSGFCGSGGCLTFVLEQQGPRMVTLLSQNLDSALGISREKIGRYRALVSLDAKGAIAIGNKPGAPLHGKPMIYPMAAAATGTASNQPPAVAAPPADAGDGSAPSVAGLRVGMSKADAEAELRKLAQRYGRRMNVQASAMRSPCARCNAYEYVVGAYRNGRFEGDTVDDGIQALLSPPSAGAQVISIYRRTLLKTPVSRDALLRQIRERHGAPSHDDGSRAIWFLGADHKSQPTPRLAKAPPGTNAPYACTTNPDEHSGMQRLMANAPALRTEGAYGTVNAECGRVLSLNTLGEATTSIELLLVDHRAVIAAALAGHAWFTEQEQSNAAKARKDMLARPVPQLN